MGKYIRSLLPVTLTASLLRSSRSLAGETSDSRIPPILYSERQCRMGTTGAVRKQLSKQLCDNWGVHMTVFSCDVEVERASRESVCLRAKSKLRQG